MSDNNTFDRRRFLSAAAVGIGSQFAMGGLARAAASANASFASVKQVHAGLLNVGYAQAGPSTGPPVVLLHGWPYDIHSYVDVVPRLAAAGHRVLVPYLRGYGETRFLSASTPRNGQPAAVAVDAISFMDAKKYVGTYEHRNLTGGIGHNLPQEAPADFAKAIIDVARA